MRYLKFFESFAVNEEVDQLLMAGIAKSVKRHGHPVTRPAVLLSGGETTVTMGPPPYGKGGRNTTFLAGLAIALGGEPGIWAMAGDTDGIDGMDEVAGALAEVARLPATDATARWMTAARRYIEAQRALDQLDRKSVV